MKIFFPLELFYPSQGGGPANSVYWLTKNLVIHGFEPIIVATDSGIEPGFPLNRWIESDAGKAIYIKTIFRYFPLRQVVCSLMNFRRAEVMHLNSVYYPASFATALAALIFNKKIVWSTRGEVDAPSLTYSKIRKFSILWIIKKFFKNRTVFHSTSDQETDYIRRIFGEDARVAQISNFIEIPPLAARADGNYLLFIGRLHPKKAIENLLLALSMSKEFLASECVLKIAGKGAPDYEKALRGYVSELNLDDKVVFVGPVIGDEKQKLFANASWTIMPSITENFGLVVVESLAQNTPVIASTGSPWEILESEKLGFWIDNSPEKIAETITQILNMRESEYKDYRRKGRAFVEREFDIKQNIGKWVALYKNI